MKIKKLAQLTAIYLGTTITTLGLTFSPAKAALLAFYPFEGNANDASGNGQDATVNGATLTASGFEGSAYEFDGLNDFIQSTLNINPSVYPQLTMGAWARSNVNAVGKTIISHDNGLFDRTLVIDNRGGGLGWSAFSGSGNVLGFKPVTIGEWTFLAVVYDQNTGSVTFYVNDQVFSESGTLGAGNNFTQIGRNPDFGQVFDGTIDNVFFFDEALSAEKIANIRLNGSSAILPATTTPEPTTILGLLAVGSLGVLTRKRKG